MTNSHKTILETLEQMVKDRGLALRPDSVGPYPGKERFPQQLYKVQDPNVPDVPVVEEAGPVIYIIQDYDVQLTADPEVLRREKTVIEGIEDEIIRLSRVFELLSYALSHHNHVPTVVVTLTDLSGSRLENLISMKILPSGEVKTDSPRLYLAKGDYREAFGVMLDMLQSTPPS